MRRGILDPDCGLGLVEGCDWGGCPDQGRNQGGDEDEGVHARMGISPSYKRRPGHRLFRLDQGPGRAGRQGILCYASSDSTWCVQPCAVPESFRLYGQGCGERQECREVVSKRRNSKGQRPVSGLCHCRRVCIYCESRKFLGTDVIRKAIEGTW